LQQLIAFAGALLAVAFAAGARIGRVDLGCLAHPLLIGFFIGAVLGLVVVLLISLLALGPQKRALPNPDVLRYYASNRARAAEMRRDLFEVEVEALEDLHEGNEKRARRHRLALRILVGPLIFAAGGAVTLVLGS
jgi:hypothetical protein